MIHVILCITQPVNNYMNVSRMSRSVFGRNDRSTQMNTKQSVQLMTSPQAAAKMKSNVKNLILAAMTLCAFMAATPKVQSQTTLAVDSTKSWIGYMNWYQLPANGGAYVNGSSWGTADLRAFFTGSNTLTLTPNTNVYNPVDPNWVTNGAGNKTMDASMYVQDDTLAGQTLTFAGTCLTNSLVSPYT